jgi:uncharacterized protein (TIGR00730 family)
MNNDPTAPLHAADQVSLADEQKVLEVVKASILNLWEAVNNLTRLRPTTRERYRVTVFGSARVARDHWVYQAVRDLAAELTRLGCDIITGGGPGLMEAANEGVRLADPDGTRHSVGIRVDLPFEQSVNAFVTQAFEHRTFFTRLHQFVLMSDAFVVVPGGIGTLLETMMIWQLLQVRKLHNTPLILAGKMYADLVAWCRANMLRPEAPPGQSGGPGLAAMCGGRSRDPADHPGSLRGLENEFSPLRKRPRRMEMVVIRKHTLALYRPAESDTGMFGIVTTFSTIQQHRVGDALDMMVHYNRRSQP